MQKIPTNYITDAALKLGSVILPVAVTRSDFLDEKGGEYYTRTRKLIYTTDLRELIPKGDKNRIKSKEKWEALGHDLDLGGNHSRFVMGNRISFTDFTIGGIIHWVQSAKEEKWHVGMIYPYGRVEDGVHFGKKS
ncbi:hypothetical protein RSOLAG1IB_10062 [Rhizoctonia solani AG-1 IB]|uniref:Glutathione S-transferase UstS-like C-terminal domain-containing protein n=1 Tax=Thanatephorus cucumeris (strain AG1-IB / isolate 7/3/14) TaxID=1108050 RepID=A0A0B7FUT8_THACB|nr:hypothetical protein RSOLAG1IB_10062 [Rhizoctonia solani AG-1 IB]